MADPVSQNGNGAAAGTGSGPEQPTAPNGEAWEGRIAEALAFARRRITGEYDVDEFGYDRELSDKALPMCRGRFTVGGFGSRSAAWRTSRTTAVPWSSPTTPAPCRSTR